MNNVGFLYWKDSEYIARFVHKWQLYGDHSDYYDGHILPVKHKWLELAHKLHCSIEEITRIGIVCDLHDAIEDTRLTYNDIMKLYSKEIADDCESLSIKSENWDYKDKDTYYQNIERGKVRIIAKVADRFVNISKILDTDNVENALKWYNKYSKEYVYYIKYNLMPGEIQPELEFIEESLIRRWLL